MIFTVINIGTGYLNRQIGYWRAIPFITGYPLRASQPGSQPTVFDRLYELSTVRGAHNVYDRPANSTVRV